MSSCLALARAPAENTQVQRTGSPPSGMLVAQEKKMGSWGSNLGRWEVRGQRNIYPAQLRPFAFMKQETTSKRQHPLLSLLSARPLVLLPLQGRQGFLTYLFLSS